MSKNKGSESTSKDDIKTLNKKYKILEEKLKNSSLSNKNYSLILVALSTYILITVYSIADIKILFPDMGLDLPFMEIAIDLISFAIFAPAILSIFYINNILKLKEHVSLIKEYKKIVDKYDFDDELKSLKQISSVPFIFNYAFLHSFSHEKAFKIFNFVIVLLFTPIVIFLTIFRFEDFHNPYITTIGYLIFFVTIYFMFSFIKFIVDLNIINNSSTDKKSLSFINSKYYIAPALFLLLGIFGYVSFYDLIISSDSYIINKFFTAKNRKGEKYIKTSLYTCRLIPLISISSTTKLPLPSFDEYTSYLKQLNKDEKNNTYRLDLYSLPKVDFSNRDLKYANLQELFLPNSRLNNSDLSYANLSKTVLYKAILESAKLKYCKLQKSKLNSAKLAKANLSYANLYKTELYNANLEESNLSFSKLIDTNLTDANLRESSLIGAKISHVFVNNANFYKASFNRAKLKKMDINYSNFRQAKFEDAKLIEINFGSSNLYSASFKHATLEKVNFGNANIDDADFADINATKDINLCFVDISKAKNMSITPKNCKDKIYNIDFGNIFNKDYIGNILEDNNDSNVSGVSR